LNTKTEIAPSPKRVYLSIKKQIIEVKKTFDILNLSWILNISSPFSAIYIKLSVPGV